MSTIDGLVSGLNTTQIISQLMQVERLPEQQLVNQQSTAQILKGVLQTLNMKVGSLATTASALIPDPVLKTSAWQSATATSSDSTRVTATADNTAVPGSISFTVTSLAAAGAAVSTGTVSSLTAAVANGPVVLAKGADQLGFAGFDPGATLAAGSHAIAVTQASTAGAGLDGTAVAGTTTIGSTNNTLSVFLDGSTTATTFTLNAGTYTPAQLAQEVQRASNGALTAGVNAAGGLHLASTHEGSAATLQVAAANVDLGLTDTTTVAAGGTDGIVTVDGVSNAVSLARSGGQVTLAGANGDSLVGTLSGGLRTGTASATDISLTSGASLSDVVSAVNASGAGVTAAAVQVSTGTFRLQLTSTTTGANSNLSLGPSAFPAGTSSLGTMQELSAGADTVLHVGTGAGAYDARSSTTTVNGLLTGVSITALAADPTKTVTVTTARDANGIADKVKALVDQANSVLGFINENDSYSATTKTGGPLLGDSLAEGIARQITDAVIGTTTSTPALAGVSVQKDGTVAFDRTAFLAAYSKDPGGVEATMTTLATQVSSAAKAASDPISGMITAQIQSADDTITSVTKSIADFEDRMTLKQQSLQQQYTALETALGKLQSQSQWLTGQLASLPTMSSSK